MRPRPPNGSEWVLNRATQMVLGVQIEGGMLAGPGPGGPKSGKSGENVR